MLTNISGKAEKVWSLFKKLLGVLSLWGLVFSVVTIGDFRVGFDYDDTLVFSTPAFSKAFKSGSAPFSQSFWEIVNNSYDLEKPKIFMNTVAWAFRIFGFKVCIITSRPDYETQGLKKEWRRLTNRFIFTGDAHKKHLHLSQGNYILYFGDSDSDITEARRARVLALRVRRNSKSSYWEDYNPGTLQELVLPLSEY